VIISNFILLDSITNKNPPPDGEGFLLVDYNFKSVSEKEGVAGLSAL